jgi:haloacetate dehalogenase
MAIAGFTETRIDCGEVRLSVHRAGQGAPLILLHGFPQSHLTWALVAPALARQFDVIVPDLRGYGASDAPPDDAEHTVYAKRTMARDIVGLMDALGLPRAHVLGHDRGARVAYRLALDHPGRVDRLGIIEVLTTADYWRAFDADLGMAIWHWTFLAQPAPLPERMIGADPGFFIDTMLTRWTGALSLDALPVASVAAYRAQMADPVRVAAMCADYRAGATTDRAQDEADRAAGRRIAAPLHFLHAEGGFPARTGIAATAWQGWAAQVTTGACVAGHFVMEENPQAVLDAFLPHFAQPPGGAQKP